MRVVVIMKDSVSLELKLLELFLLEWKFQVKISYDEIHIPFSLFYSLSQVGGESGLEAKEVRTKPCEVSSVLFGES